MLRVSISRTDAAPSPTATARLRMIGASRSRWAAESVLESRTPRIRWLFGAMITAAATTAPQVGATPTSSMPTTRVRPARQCGRSNRRVGTRGAIARSGYPADRGLDGPEILAGGGPAMPGSGPGSALAQGCGLADPIAQEVE